MQTSQIAYLPDGRLHLHHGPIDLIIDVTGNGRRAGLDRAIQRFETVLQELAGELADLRRPVSVHHAFQGRIARVMYDATAAYEGIFVTPMAAVAGAVADEILRSVCDGAGIEKAYVNNGGDVALFLAPGESYISAIAGPVLPSRIEIRGDDPVQGIATSGWRGRSQSLGIADSVTVLATTAAEADVAATLIANQTDLPGHRLVTRAPACEFSPDSDLGDRLVTVDVGPLTEDETAGALDRGQIFAAQCLSRDLITGACLFLNGSQRLVGASHLVTASHTELIDA